MSSDAIGAAGSVSQSIVQDHRNLQRSNENRDPQVERDDDAYARRVGAVSGMSGSAESADVSTPSGVVEPRGSQGVESVDNQRLVQQGSVLTPEEEAEQLLAAVEKINEAMQEGDRSLSFSIDKETEQLVVSIIDTETDEVVRQVPSEEALELAKRLETMIGLILNAKA